MVAETRQTAVCVNKFPYNSGHLLIFPKRHIIDYRDFHEEEELEIHRFLRTSLDVLDSIYSPSGYNFGYNMVGWQIRAGHHLSNSFLGRRYYRKAIRPAPPVEELVHLTKVTLEDYNIKIPKMVIKNIAEIVDVNVDLNMKLIEKESQ